MIYLVGRGDELDVEVREEMETQAAEENELSCPAEEVN